MNATLASLVSMPAVLLHLVFCTWRILNMLSSKHTSALVWFSNCYNQMSDHCAQLDDARSHGGGWAVNNNIMRDSCYSVTACWRGVMLRVFKSLNSRQCQIMRGRAFLSRNRSFCEVIHFRKQFRVCISNIDNKIAYNCKVSQPCTW